MVFPKTDQEIKAFGLLLKICRLEEQTPSPYGPENESLKRVIAKNKIEYLQLINSASGQKVNPTIEADLNALNIYLSLGYSIPNNELPANGFLGIPHILKKELEKFFDWYKGSNFSSSGKTSDLIDVYLGQWKPTVTKP